VLADAAWELQERDFDRWVSRSLLCNIAGVYTYEHAALQTLRKAKKLGVFGFLEQPAPHFAFFQRVLAEEVRRFPEIANSETALHSGRKARRLYHV
jgi:hypothetical protein